MWAAPILFLLMQPAEPPPRFGTLWLDWKALGREAGAAELAPPPHLSRRSDEAAALGERVGEAVSGGDCAIGERLAREAGDIPLARAVRKHCYGSQSIAPPPAE